jgi:hypothetical protein
MSVSTACSIPPISKCAGPPITICIVRPSETEIVSRPHHEVQVFGSCPTCMNKASICRDLKDDGGQPFYVLVCEKCGKCQTVLHGPDDLVRYSNCGVCFRNLHKRCEATELPRNCPGCHHHFRLCHIPSLFPPGAGAPFRISIPSDRPGAPRHAVFMVP